MDIADFLPRLLIDAPECPDAAARSAIVTAAAEMCRETLIWNEVQDPYILIDNQAVYDIEVPDDAQVVAVMAGETGGNPITPKTLAQVAALMPDWQTAVSARPIYLTASPGAATVRLFPMPRDANRAAFSLRVAYAPVWAATELPDELVEQHGELILSGARARLMVQPRKPWSDAKLGAFNGTQFEAGKIDLRARVLHDMSPGTLTASDSAPAFGF